MFYSPVSNKFTFKTWLTALKFLFSPNLPRFYLTRRSRFRQGWQGWCYYTVHLYWTITFRSFISLTEFMCLTFTFMYMSTDLSDVDLHLNCCLIFSSLNFSYLRKCINNNIFISSINLLLLHKRKFDKIVTYRVFLNRFTPYNRRLCKIQRLWLIKRNTKLK